MATTKISVRQSPTIAQSIMSQTTNVTIIAGYSAIVVRKYTIASGTKLIIESGAIFKIQ